MNSSPNSNPKYNVIPIEDFQKQAKRLVKKYHSLLQELPALRQSLSVNPAMGTPIGRNCYKIRLPIASKGKGKRGGARVITFVALIQETVYLLSIYDKSDKETIGNEEIRELLDKIIIP